MKHLKLLFFILSLLLLFAACAKAEDSASEGVKITLSDDLVQVDGRPISTADTDAVYAAKDIVCYVSGKDFTYGEGEEKDAHTLETAAAHTAVHISEPGYIGFPESCFKIRSQWTWAKMQSKTLRQW